MEAASLAWHPLGWKCAFVSEIEKAPCALLEQRYPDVPNFGDMTKFEEWPDVAIDLLAGGTPCQSFSVAGLRKGLADPRGSLMLTYGAIAQRYRPTWLFWENVPGVLSSNGGRDFGAFLGMLAELGYGFAHRVLDAQFFGLAQRRKRVFVVGHLGDWRPPAAVLFELESLRGDSPPRRREGQGVAGSIGASPDRCGTIQDAYAGNLIAFGSKEYAQDAGDVSPPLRAMGHNESWQNGGGQVAIAFDTTQITSPECRSQPGPGKPCHTLASQAHPPAVAFQTSGNCGAWETGDMTGALDTNTDPNSHVIAFALRGREGGAMPEIEGAGDKASSLRSASGGSSRDMVSDGFVVRRLSPRECERLQGAPDDYTLITYRGKPIADGPRYKMIGNSWAVPCVRWIGERIALVDSCIKAANGEQNNG